MLTADIDLLSPVNWLAPLNRGLVGWWMAMPGLMSGGGLVDLLGQHIATLTSGASWSTAAHAGGAGSIALDGTDDHLQTTLGIADTPGITVSAWANLTAAGNFPQIASYGTNANAVAELRGSGTTGKLSFVNRGNNNGATEATASNGTGWHHWIGTGNKVTLTLYKDGVQAATSATAHSTAGTTVSYRFGRRSDDAFGSFPFPGYLNDIRIYRGRVLTAFEARELYLASSQCYPDELNRVEWLAFPPAAAVGNPWNYFAQIAG